MVCAVAVLALVGATCVVRGQELRGAALADEGMFLRQDAIEPQTARELRADAPLETSDDLRARYGAIFRTGNRNAASHLWTSYILRRAKSMRAATIKNLFRFFCPASIRVDTKTVQTVEGPRQFRFLVIGDPCIHPQKLSQMWQNFGEWTSLSNDAPEVRCQDGNLVGAVYSDHGHPIIGMLHDIDPSLDATDASEVEEKCVARKAAGYNSGMGAIFLKVAGINPDFVSIHKKSPDELITLRV